MGVAFSVASFPSLYPVMSEAQESLWWGGSGGGEFF